MVGELGLRLHPAAEKDARARGGGWDVALGARRIAGEEDFRPGSGSLGTGWAWSNQWSPDSADSPKNWSGALWDPWCLYSSSTWRRGAAATCSLAAGLG